MQVYEIARESGISNQEIIATLKNLGFEVKNHMSVVDDGMYAALEKEMGKLKSDPQPQEKPLEAKKKEYIVAFISSKKGLKLWIKGPEVNIIPGVGRHIVQGSGSSVEFKQGKYQTSDKEKIEFLLAHKGFSGNSGNWFFPDPVDPTGFWLDQNYYKEEMVKTRTPVDPNVILKEGKKQAVNVARGFAKTEMQSLRTSNARGG